MTTPTTGHNGAPDPIDEALAPYSDTITEAEGWLDGEPVTTEGQMQAVDALIKAMRTCSTDIGKAKKSATAPMHDAWKLELARWKPTEDDIGRIKTGLPLLVGPFKAKLAAEKEEAKRKAFDEARHLEQEAKRKAMAVDASNIEAQREADAALEDAKDAQKAAQAANRDTVKGMRMVMNYEIKDRRAALHWIAQNDKDAMTAFIDEYVRKNHKTALIGGVNRWESKEAY